jgi:hypothetical protein
MLNKGINIINLNELFCEKESLPLELQERINRFIVQLDERQLSLELSQLVPFSLLG